MAQGALEKAAVLASQQEAAQLEREVERKRAALELQIGTETVGGATGALIGTAGIAAAFAVVVLALAIVLAVVYGLGFLFVGLAIFIPLVILVSLFPVLAPFILLGLAIWWLVRRSKREAAAEASSDSAVK